MQYLNAGVAWVLAFASIKKPARGRFFDQSAEADRYYLAGASAAAEAALEAASAADEAAEAALEAAAAASAAGAVAVASAAGAAGATTAAGAVSTTGAGVTVVSSFLLHAVRATAIREMISRDFFMVFP
jgi:hypothetical protein